jgi:hypothetical protein
LTSVRFAFDSIAAGFGRHPRTPAPDHRFATRGPRVP